MKAEKDGKTNESDGQRGRMLANGEPGDDVSRVPSLRSLGNFSHRSAINRGVVVRDHDHDSGHKQPDQRSEIKIVGATRNARDRDAVREKGMCRGPEENG